MRGDLLQRAVARLRKRYVKQRRLRAQLTAGVPVFHPESNTVDYTFEVERGPVVDIRAEGMQLSRGKLKRYVPVYEEHAVDEDLLNEGRRNLRDYLQGQGYFDAVVQVRQDEDAEHDREHIVYSIQRGQQHRLRAIDVVGNKRFDTATLRERMGTQVSSVLQPHGRYSQAILANDLQAIKNLYLANGYESVKVTQRSAGRLRRRSRRHEDCGEGGRGAAGAGGPSGDSWSARGERGGDPRLDQHAGGAAVLRSDSGGRPGSGVERLLQPGLSVGATGQFGDLCRRSTHADGRGV